MLNDLMDSGPDSTALIYGGYPTYYFNEVPMENLTWDDIQGWKR